MDEALAKALGHHLPWCIFYRTEMHFAEMPQNRIIIMI